MVRKGILDTNKQKGRLFEMIVLDFSEESISGDNCKNPFDGICPKGQIYDAKSAGLRYGQYWQFPINKGGGVDFWDRNRQ